MIKQSKVLVENILNYINPNFQSPNLILLFQILFFSILCTIFYYFLRVFLVFNFKIFLKKSKTKWDIELIRVYFFRKISLLFSVMIFSFIFNELISIKSFYLIILNKIIYLFILFMIVNIVFSFLNALNQILLIKEKTKFKPITSFIQIGKIIIYIISFTLFISILTGKNPIYFFTAMGALSAVLLLIFKDTILGLVSSIIVATNDIVRIGDWITMSKHEADGTVEDISLTNIKVRNFDNTISTVPTYALINESFKNWRGMKESGGRRLKRAIYIDVNTIKLCDNEFFNKIRKIKILNEYINRLDSEIPDKESTLNNELYQINFRSITNIGLFRNYLSHYLINNENVNNEMGYLVRQLDSSEFGVPMEVMCFINEKEWENFEMISSDIFDHIFGIIHYFDLKVYQKPSGNDFNKFENII